MPASTFLFRLSVLTDALTDALTNATTYALTFPSITQLRLS